MTCLPEDLLSDVLPPSDNTSSASAGGGSALCVPPMPVAGTCFEAGVGCTADAHCCSGVCDKDGVATTHPWECGPSADEQSQDQQTSTFSQQKGAIVSASVILVVVAAVVLIAVYV